MSAKILVVDDEESLQVLIQEILRREGYEVALASDGKEGLVAFYGWKPDLVVLDLMMPRMDGWQVLERIREVSETPVIILSALGQKHQVVQGLHEGADDYVIKPFHTDELLARVKAALRKAKPADATDAYQDSNLTLDFSNHQVYLRGDKVDLSPQEFRLLGALVKYPGQVLTTERLLDQCWGAGEGAGDSLRVYIGYLRKKLQDNPRNPELIETVREFGYRYRPPSG
ncbi:MAG: response regulator transcription factor [Chloroflexi bacterium]|nr:response regulator transcription factor [Chloroflexota bacterium]